MKKILFLSMIVLTISSCVIQESERQKRINAINLQSKNYLDSILMFAPNKKYYFGKCSLDTTGLMNKYYTIRKDSAELGFVFVKKIEADIEKLRLKQDSIVKAYWKSENGYTFNLCPYWSEEDIQKLKDGKTWIGMELDMLIYRYQNRPDHNVSDYGNGQRHQWYFRDGSPAYYYTDGDSRIVTAYN